MVPKQITLTIGDAPEPRVKMAEAIWFAWLRIAAEHATQAKDEAESRGMDGDTMRPAMVSISAAAFALAGFAASLRRHSEIERFDEGDEPEPSASWLVIETLKRTAELGSRTNEFQQMVKWLFTLRDPLVHPGEKFREAVRIPELPDAQVSVETRDYSADNAVRSVNIVLDIVEHCFANPRPATRDWLEMREGLLRDKAWLKQFRRVCCK